MHSLVHGRGAASTAGRSFWREVGHRADALAVSGRNRRATMRAKGDVGLRASRGGSPRAQPLQFDAFEPSSAGWAFRRSRHSLSSRHARRIRRSSHLKGNWRGLLRRLWARIPEFCAALDISYILEMLRIARTEQPCRRRVRQGCLVGETLHAACGASGELEGQVRASQKLNRIAGQGIS